MVAFSKETFSLMVSMKHKQQEEKMNNVYFYGRNSDIESAEKGSSLATQKLKAEAYAQLKDLVITEYFYDQISGTVLLKEGNKVLF